MQKYILTVGPALGNEVQLREIHNEKNIYRINGAHGSVPDIEKSICNIRGQIPDAEILLDLPGNKVRKRVKPLKSLVISLIIKNFTVI